MLVLLIIFMVTASVSENVKLELPKATVDERPPSPRVPPITLSVREDGAIFWADEQLQGKEMLDSRLAVEAQKLPQPDVLLRADAETKYSLIQDVTTRVRVAGMRSINFVSEPEAGN
jgi:biopolymer transport protein ExbD